MAPITSTRSSVRSSKGGGFGFQRRQINRVLESASPLSRTLVLVPENGSKNRFKMLGPKWTEAPARTGLPVRFFRKKWVPLVPVFGTNIVTLVRILIPNSLKWGGPGASFLGTKIGMTTGKNRASSWVQGARRHLEKRLFWALQLGCLRLPPTHIFRGHLEAEFGWLWHPDF